MSDEQTNLVNWLNENVTEYRDFDDEVLAFIWASDLRDLGKLLKELDGDYFTDGSMELSFNGEDIVFDIKPILATFEINPKLLKNLTGKIVI